MKDPLVFISYCHGNDHVWKERLQTHLESFAWTKSQLNVFADTHRHAFDIEEEKIGTAIEQTAVAVLLISPDFLTSQLTQTKELPRFLKRHREQAMPIVPIIIEPCEWQKTELAQLVVRPNEGKPLSRFGVQEQQKIMVEIAREINQLYVRQIDQEDKITIVVADDREFTVRGLRDIFEDDFANDMVVVGLARTPSETERAIIEFVPDILLLDMSWYRDDEMGFRLIERVKDLSPMTKVIAISNHLDLLEEAKKKGIATLDKDFTIFELFKKVREVYQQDPENMVEKILFEGLTEREVEVLSLVAQGLQDKEIQAALVVSLSTVKKHISNILAKTGVKSRTEAAVKAREYGVV